MPEDEPVNDEEVGEPERTDPKRAVQTYIQLLIDKEGRDESQVDTFTDWYSKLRKGFEVKHRGIQGDGVIDLILESPKSVILVQIKYYEAEKGKIKEFHDTIQKWLNPHDFRDWLDNDVSNLSYKRTYQGIFTRIRDSHKEMTWEFVCLNKLDQQTFKKYSNDLAHNIPRSIRTKLVTADRLYYYSMLERVGAGPTEPLEVYIAKNSFTTYSTVINGIHVNTSICVMNLDDLIRRLRRQPDSQAYFARNVRLLQLNSVVNNSIKSTFLNEDQDFFLDNNGVSIVCVGANNEPVDEAKDLVHIDLPAIINGGQTINSLLYIEDAELKPAKVLARITQIQESDQTTDEAKRLIEKMILRSNSNNTMYPWDLKSNDVVQVELAKEMYDRGIFYERKSKEYKQTQTSLKSHIDSVRLAQNFVISTDILDGAGKGGPSWLKQIGKEPLFTKTGLGDYYNLIFPPSLDYDLLERQTQLFLGVDKAIRKRGNSNILPKKDSGFRLAAENFIYGIIWRAIKDDTGLATLSFRENRNDEMKSLLRGLVKEMYKLFKQDLKTRDQNNIFRDDDCWERAKSHFLTTDWKRRIVRAVTDDMSEEQE